MSLSLYRRHARIPGKCSGGHQPDAQTYESDERRRAWKRCSCPIYASGTIGGAGPASDPVGVTTAAASVPPSAPADVNASWTVQDPVGSTDTLVVTWSASDPGDSPVDQYQVTITGSDGGGTFTRTVSGTTLEASFAVDYGPDWTVTVSAHNAVGWSPWSDPVTLGGL